MTPSSNFNQFNDPSQAQDNIEALNNTDPTNKPLTNFNANETRAGESSYQAYLRQLNPHLYEEETNPFALEMFGMDPRTMKVDETFDLPEYDPLSDEVSLDRLEFFQDHRYLPVQSKMPLDLTHRLNLGFTKRPLYSILSYRLPVQERPLTLLDLQEIRWLKTSLERQEGDLVKKRQELAVLESRPVSFEVFLVRCKTDWKQPFYLARLFLGYVKSRTKLQFWPFWADTALKQEIAREFLKRFVHTLSFGRTSEWPVLKQAVINDFTNASNLRIQREFLWEHVLNDALVLCQQKGIRENLLIYVAFNALLYAAFLSPWRHKFVSSMPIFASPTEHVEWETLRTQEERGDLYKALDKVVRIEISQHDVVMELTHQDHNYHAYWGDSRPNQTLQAISSFQARESTSEFSLNQNFDENLDEFPLKLASQSWVEGSRQFMSYANVADNTLPTHRIHTLVASTNRFKQLQQTPVIVPQTQWLETWFADNSDNETTLITLKPSNPDRVMSGYRYPDMDTDQVRFLWLRQFLFGAKKVRRRVRTKLGVYRSLPRFQPTLSPLDMQKPSSRGFSNTLVQWLAFLGNEGDISYSKLPASLMNLDVLSQAQLDIDEIKSLTPEKWEETYKKPLFDILQMPDTSFSIDQKDQTVDMPDTSFSLDQPVDSIDRQVANSLALKSFVEGDIDMYEVHDLFEAGFISESLFNNLQKVISSLQVFDAWNKRLEERSDLEQRSFDRVIIDLMQTFEETRQKCINEFEEMFQVALDSDLQPILKAGHNLGETNLLIMKDQKDKADVKEAEKAETEKALKKIQQAKAEKLAAKRARDAERNRLMNDQTALKALYEYQKMTFPSEQVKLKVATALHAQLEERMEILQRVKAEYQAELEAEKNEQEEEAKKERQAAEEKAKAKLEVVIPMLTEQEEMIQRFYYHLGLLHEQLAKFRIDTECEIVNRYFLRDVHLTARVDAKNLYDKFLFDSKSIELKHQIQNHFDNLNFENLKPTQSIHLVKLPKPIDIRSPKAVNFEFGVAKLVVPKPVTEVMNQDGANFDSHMSNTSSKSMNGVVNTATNFEQNQSLPRKIFRVVTQPGQNIKILHDDIISDSRILKKVAVRIKKKVQNQTGRLTAAASKIKSACRFVIPRWPRQKLPKNVTSKPKEDEIVVSQKPAETSEDKEQIDLELIGRSMDLEVKRGLMPMLTDLVAYKGLMMDKRKEYAIRDTLHLEQNKQPEDVLEFRTDALEPEIESKAKRPKIKILKKKGPEYQYVDQEGNFILEIPETVEPFSYFKAEELEDEQLEDEQLEDEQLIEDSKPKDEIMSDRAIDPENEQKDETGNSIKQEQEEQVKKEQKETKKKDSLESKRKIQKPQVRRELADILDIVTNFSTNQVNDSLLSLDDGKTKPSNMKNDEQVWFDTLDWSYLIETDPYWELFVQDPDYGVFNYDFEEYSRLDFASSQLASQLLPTYKHDSPEFQALVRRNSFLRNFITSFFPYVANKSDLKVPGHQKYVIKDMPGSLKVYKVEQRRRKTPDLLKFVPYGALLDTVLSGPSTMPMKARWFGVCLKDLAKPANPFDGFRLTDLMLGYRQRAKWKYEYFHRVFLDWWMYSGLGQRSDARFDRQIVPNIVKGKKWSDSIEKWRKEAFNTLQYKINVESLIPSEGIQQRRQEFLDHVDHLNFGPCNVNLETDLAIDNNLNSIQGMIDTVYQPNIETARQYSVRALGSNETHENSSMILDYVRKLDQIGDELVADRAILLPSNRLTSDLRVEKSSGSNDEESRLITAEEYENIQKKLKLQQYANPSLPSLTNLAAVLQDLPGPTTQGVDIESLDENGLITHLPAHLLVETQMRLRQMHLLVDKLKRVHVLCQKFNASKTPKTNEDAYYKTSMDQISILINTLNQQIRIFSLELIAYKNNPSLVQKARLNELTRYLGQATRVSDLDSIDSNLLDTLWRHLDFFPWAIQEDIFLMFKGIEASRQPYADTEFWNYSRDRTEKVSSNPLEAEREEGRIYGQPSLKLRPDVSPLTFNENGQLIFHTNTKSEPKTDDRSRTVSVAKPTPSLAGIPKTWARTRELTWEEQIEKEVFEELDKEWEQKGDEFLEKIVWPRVPIEIADLFDGIENPGAELAFRSKTKPVSLQDLIDEHYQATKHLLVPVPKGSDLSPEQQQKIENQLLKVTVQSVKNSELRKNLREAIQKRDFEALLKIIRFEKLYQTTDSETIEQMILTSARYKAEAPERLLKKEKALRTYKRCVKRALLIAATEVGFSNDMMQSIKAYFPEVGHVNQHIDETFWEEVPIWTKIVLKAMLKGLWGGIQGAIHSSKNENFEEIKAGFKKGYTKAAQKSLHDSWRKRWVNRPKPVEKVTKLDKETRRKAAKQARQKFSPEAKQIAIDTVEILLSNPVGQYYKSQYPEVWITHDWEKILMEMAGVEWPAIENPAGDVGREDHEKDQLLNKPLDLNVSFWQELIKFWERMPLPILERVHAQAMNRLANGHSMQDEIVRLLGEQGANELHHHRAMLIQLRKGEWRNITFPWKRYHENWARMRSRRITGRRHTRKLYAATSEKIKRTSDKSFARRIQNRELKRLRMVAPRLNPATSPFPNSSEQLNFLVLQAMRDIEVDTDQETLLYDAGFTKSELKLPKLPIYLEDLDQFVEWATANGFMEFCENEGEFRVSVHHLDTIVKPLWESYLQCEIAKLNDIGPTQDEDVLSQWHTKVHLNSAEFRQQLQSPRFVRPPFDRFETFRRSRERRILWEQRRKLLLDQRGQLHEKMPRDRTRAAQAEVRALLNMFQKIWKDVHVHIRHPQWDLNKLSEHQGDDKEENIEQEFAWRVPLDPYQGDLDVNRLRQLSSRYMQDAYQAGMNTSMQETRQGMMAWIQYPYEPELHESIDPEENKKKEEEREQALTKMRTKLARSKFPSWVPLSVAQAFMPTLRAVDVKDNIDAPPTVLVEIGRDMYVGDINPDLNGDISDLLRVFAGFYSDDKLENELKKRQEVRKKIAEEEQEKKRATESTDIQEIREENENTDDLTKLEENDKDKIEDEPGELPYIRYVIRELRHEQKQQQANLDFSDAQQNEFNVLAERLQRDEKDESCEPFWSSSIRLEDRLDSQRVPLIDHEKFDSIEDDQRVRNRVEHEIFRRLSLILEHSFQGYLRGLKDDEWIFSSSFISLDGKKPRKERMEKMVDVMTLLDYSSLIPGETLASYQQDFNSIVSPFAVHLLQNQQLAANPKFYVDRLPILRQKATILPWLSVQIRSPLDLWGSRRWQTKLQARSSIECLNSPPLKLKGTQVMPDSNFNWLKDYWLVVDQVMPSKIDTPVYLKVMDRKPSAAYSPNLRSREAYVVSHRTYVHELVSGPKVESSLWNTKLPISQLVHRPRVHAIARNPYRRKMVDRSLYDYMSYTQDSMERKNAKEEIVEHVVIEKKLFPEQQLSIKEQLLTDKVLRAGILVNSTPEDKVKQKSDLKLSKQEESQKKHQHPIEEEADFDIILETNDLIEQQEEDEMFGYNQPHTALHGRAEKLSLQYRPYGAREYESDIMFRDMTVVPTRYVTRRWLQWRKWGHRLPWSKFVPTWSERFYGKETLLITPESIHPISIASRVWIISMQTQMLILVIIPFIRRRLYAFAKWMKWIEIGVWSLEYLDRKGMTNKRTLDDLVALPDFLYIELCSMVAELKRKEFERTKRVWVRAETEEDFEKKHKDPSRFFFPQWTRTTLRRPIIYHAGALLVGPPGTGKTLLAQALAGSSGIRFIGTCASEFFATKGKAVKAAPRNIHYMFRYARNHAPCLVFIDEIDTIASVRSGHAVSQNFPPFTLGNLRDLRYWNWRPGVYRRRKKTAGTYWKLKSPLWSPEPLTRELYLEHVMSVEIEHWQGADIGLRRNFKTREKDRDESFVTIQLLAEIDGCYEKSKVFLMGTTNRLSRIDAAITRPGRIDRVIYLGPPDTRQRMEILRHYVADGCFPFRPNQLTWSEVFFMTTDMTPADIKTLVNESKVYSVLQEIRLENNLGRRLWAELPHAHTTKSIERGVAVVTSILSIDRRREASERNLREYDPLIWSRLAYARAGRALISVLMPSGVFVGITLFAERPRGRKIDPIYAKLDQQAYLDTFEASQCKQVILIHLAALASKFLMLQRRTPEGTGLAWLDKQHMWDLELASAYAYKITDQWSLLNPYVTLPKFVLGPQSNVNFELEKRVNLQFKSKYRGKFKAWYGPRQKARRLGRLFKIQESSAFQQHDYMFGMPKGQENYIADMMGQWWRNYTFMSVIKRKVFQMQVRRLNLWQKGLIGKYKNIFWISPISYSSPHSVRVWNQQSGYLDQRDSQTGHILRSGFELVSKLLETYRPIVDLLVVPLLINSKLRAKQVAKILRPFQLKPHLQNGQNVNFFPDLQYMPRRLERSWRLESNRFVGQRQIRMIVPENIELWDRAIRIPNVPLDFWPEGFERFQNTTRTMNRHLDVMEDALDLLSRSIKYDKIEPVAVTDQNMKKLIQLLGTQEDLNLPDPDRCGYIQYTNIHVATSDFFLLTPDHPNQLEQLDPVHTPAKQLQHLAVQLTYPVGIEPIISTVQAWILRWLQQEIDILDLFRFILLFDSVCDPKQAPNSLLHPGNIHQVLCGEPRRYAWLLKSKPEEVLWGQAVLLDRVDAWSEFCHDLRLNLDTYQPSKDLVNSSLPSDPVQATLRKMLSGLKFPTVGLVSEDFANELLDISERWITQANRHTELISSLMAHVNHLDGDLEDVQTALNNMLEAEKHFIQMIPALRDDMCEYVEGNIRRYSYSINVGRLVCMHSTCQLYQIRDSLTFDRHKEDDSY